MALNGRIAVIGLGSPIMCDDAVGLRVSEAIDALGMDDVDCFQEAIGGLDILPVIHGYSHAIVVDAIQTGEYGPGTVLLFRESDFDEVIADAATHDVNLPTAIKIGRKSYAVTICKSHLTMVNFVAFRKSLIPFLSQYKFLFHPIYLPACFLYPSPIHLHIYFILMDKNSKYLVFI